MKRYNTTIPMKKIGKAALSISFAALLVACGQPQDNSDLGQLKQKKDSLKTVYADLATQIAAIDAQIATLDTGKKNMAVVTTIQPEVKQFTHYFTVQGEVETEKNAQIFPSAAGEIVSINVEEGQQVKEGDVILRLDAAVLNAQLQELEKAYELVEETYGRQEKLWEQKIGSEMQFLKIKNEKEGLEKKINSLKQQMDMYVVRAPFSGIIDEITPKKGESANPQFPIGRIVNLDKVYIKSDVSEGYLKSVKAGSSVKVNFPSIGKEMVTKINRVGNFINPNNRTFKVKIELENGDNSLKPNLLADVQIMDHKIDSAIVIPAKIVQEDRRNNQYVYVLGAGNTVEKAIIKTGISYKGETVILEGLKGNEIIIDKGARSVQNNDVVSVING